MIALWLLACVNQDISLMEVRVSAEIISDHEGPVTVSFQHAWSAEEGALSYPLRPIEDIWRPGPGALSHTLIYPLDEGEGLVLYAWQDRDGDGALCAPGVDDEGAGLAEAEAFPAFELSLSVRLDALCVGPERLFP